MIATLRTGNLVADQGSIDFSVEVAVSNARLSSVGSIYTLDPGIKNESEPILESETDNSQHWSSTFRGYVLKDKPWSFGSYARTEDGSTFVTPHTANITGDRLVDTNAASLLASRWSSAAQNPTFLDIYPHQGRGANSRLYYQLDVEDDTEVLPGDVIVYLRDVPLLEGSFNLYGYPSLLTGNVIMGTWGARFMYPIKLIGIK